VSQILEIEAMRSRWREKKSPADDLFRLLVCIFVFSSLVLPIVASPERTHTSILPRANPTGGHTHKNSFSPSTIEGHWEKRGGVLSTASHAFIQGRYVHLRGGGRREGDSVGDEKERLRGKVAGFSLPVGIGIGLSKR